MRSVVRSTRPTAPGVAPEAAAARRRGRLRCRLSAPSPTSAIKMMILISTARPKAVWTRSPKDRRCTIDCAVPEAISAATLVSATR